ncbi:hypothetical protein CDD83_7422 [Cordyceps sp. RAO-2017]|nr:hypothetical protein CDD83_7422 [Cordyceps sp. RAO-2017]
MPWCRQAEDGDSDRKAADADVGSGTGSAGRRVVRGQSFQRALHALFRPCRQMRQPSCRGNKFPTAFPGADLSGREDLGPKFDKRVQSFRCDNCVFESFVVYVRLENWVRAGTNYRVFFEIGHNKGYDREQPHYLMKESPSSGDVMARMIDVRDAFGKDLVTVADVSRLAVVARTDNGGVGTGDQIALRDVILEVQCAGSARVGRAQIAGSGWTAEWVGQVKPENWEWRGDQYISGVDVVYEDDPPREAVKQVDLGNADINSGYGGKFVWLVPTYSDRREDACTEMVVTIQYDSIPSLNDLAAGTGGHFRYLTCKKDAEKLPIRHLALHRSESEVQLEDIRKDKYNGMTMDINKDRRGTFLYLLWRT